MSIENFEPKKILVCQQRQIGDVILTTAAVEALQKRFKQAEIHFVTEKKCMPMLENNPYIKKLWLIDTKKNFFEEYLWYLNFAKEKFDLVVNFQNLPRLRAISFFSKAKVKLAPNPAWYLKFLYTHTAKVDDSYAAISKINMLEQLGIKYDHEKPHIFLTNAEEENAKQILKDCGLKADDIFISLDVTHKDNRRKWQTENFAKMMQQILDKSKENKDRIFFFPFFAPGEEEDVNNLQEFCVKYGIEKHILKSNKTLSLREVVALIKHASLHIGNCSAPRHIAVAVGTKSLAVLGSTSTVWTFPSDEHIAFYANLECQPCETHNCQNNFACLNAIKPEQMSEQAIQMLGDKLCQR